MADAGGAGSPAESQQVLAGRYRLIRLLAEGGMAAVWEGRDEILARPVAVKVPHARLASDPTFRERFRREAVSAARLAHPGIVATYDTGADGATDFIVMELVPGRTVGDLVAGGPVPASVAVPLMAQVAEALDVAHRAGLIHRDIKPANILLVEDEPERPSGAGAPGPERPAGAGGPGPVRRVKVADFGVARIQQSDRLLSGGDVTRDGLVVGTARYLAPEQVGARPVDGRTDVYAVGCVLHELLAGQPPFVRETDLATAMAHLTEPPPSLSSLGVAVSPALERLVLACLAKDPADRPASALLLAQQLRALAAPPANPPTAPVPRVDLSAGAGPAEGPGRSAPVPAAPTTALSVPHAAGAPRPERPRRAGEPGPERPRRAGEPRPERPRRAGEPGPQRPHHRGAAIAAPAAAAPAPARSTRTVGRPTRSRVPFVVVGCLVLAALATALLVVVLPPGAGTPTTARSPTSGASGRPTVAGVRPFDPEADGRENNGQLASLVDGNPATTWSSDRYNLRPVFGNLKKGVGVVLALDRPVRLGSLRVRSPSKAWAAQVYVAAAPAGTLAAWGQPVARASGVQGDLEVDLDGKSGGAVLVWFTNPGSTGQVVVGEVELDSP